MFGDHLNTRPLIQASVIETSAIPWAAVYRRLRRVKEHKHADIVAAVKASETSVSRNTFMDLRGNKKCSLSNTLRILARPRILIAAHGGINHVVGNDACLIVMISNAA